MAFTATATIIPRTPTVPEVSLEQTESNTFLSQLQQDVLNVFVPENNQDWAETISYHHSTGEVLNYPAIFRFRTVSVNTKAGAEIISRRPYVRMATSRLARNPLAGDKLYANGQWWYVENPEATSAGVTDLELRKR